LSSSVALFVATVLVAGIIYDVATGISDILVTIAFFVLVYGVFIEILEYYLRKRRSRVPAVPSSPS